MNSLKEFTSVVVIFIFICNWCCLLGMWCNIRKANINGKKESKHNPGGSHNDQLFSVLWHCELIWRICSSDSNCINRFIVHWADGRYSDEKMVEKILSYRKVGQQSTYTDLTLNILIFSKAEIMWTVRKEIEANVNPPLEADAFAHTPLSKSLFYALPSFHLMPLLMHSQTEAAHGYSATCSANGCSH